MRLPAVVVIVLSWILNLNDGNVERVIKAIEALSALPGYDREQCEREVGYFEKNK